MSLPIPNLDDRRFQDLVDDAKRLVQQRCPEWTDHNVSDPGVTLIESFAFMVDQLLYRLNRVPDRLYITFLDLLGVTLHPPTAARADVTAWLSAPQPEPVVLPAGAEVATPRTTAEDTIVFATTAELVMPPRSLAHLFTQGVDDEHAVSRHEELRLGTDFGCFTAAPQQGDLLLLGLDDAAPSCAIAFRFDCDVQGVGVDPLYPPLAWEAWTGSEWTACEVDHDDTGGLNKAGDVVVHLPAQHAASVIEQTRAGWVRCRVVAPIEGYPFYGASPTVRAASAFTVGGTVAAVHAEAVSDEILGLSEGVPGQTFAVARAPVVAGDAFEIEVAGGSGWERWTSVDSFAGCGPDDRVVRIDRSTGEVHFAPAVREPDGTLRRYGAVPPKGAPLRVPVYRTGGGPQGNLAADAISVLRTPVPMIDRVQNRRAAIGGVAGETVDQARIRGPLALRTRDRAVTPEDYEQLARTAAPEIARVKCLPATDPSSAGVVRVLVVPSAPADAAGRLRFEDLVPPARMMESITADLDSRRTVGARVVVEPPFYQGVTVIARLVARPRTATDELQRDALVALHRYFDPLTGGPYGEGWPFGRPVQAGEVYAVLQRLSGTEFVDDVKLFPADPITKERDKPTQRIELDTAALVFSFQHQVRVTRGG